MLTCDAFGVLPPLARLTADQALYHFLSGYTAKVAGTEKGLSHEPAATFSTCFGAPFLALRPTVYSNLLKEKIARHNVNCWLVNTGWSGGGFGVGHRVKIAYTRAMIHAALNGKMDGIPVAPDPTFQVLVPESCNGVPSDILCPRKTWRNQNEYDREARNLAGLFQDNFKQFAGMVSSEVRDSGPRIH
jgi:phosphoenolpyruvate carboxykinase (ATP)